MSETKISPAFLVQPEAQYNIRRIVATVVLPHEGGVMHSPGSWDFGFAHDVAQFDGFEVSCYLGDTTMGATVHDSGRLWGFGHSYSVHRIDHAEHARAIGTVLAKVQRHLDKANTDDGYLSEGDFHNYVLRVAAALKIRDVYVRNLPRARDMGGETYRKVTGSALQSWLKQVSEHAAKSELAAIGFR